MTDAELLRLIRDGLVHRSSDGRDWLALAGGGFADVTVRGDRLYDQGLVWWQRNTGGWWAVLRLTGAGEVATGRRQQYLPRILTEQDVELVVRLYGAGENMHKIARLMQTSEKKIRATLTDAGVQVRRPGRNREAASQ